MSGSFFIDCLSILFSGFAWYVDKVAIFCFGIKFDLEKKQSCSAYLSQLMCGIHSLLRNTCELFVMICFLFLYDLYIFQFFHAGIYANREQKNLSVILF